MTEHAVESLSAETQSALLALMPSYGASGSRSMSRRKDPTLDPR